MHDQALAPVLDEGHDLLVEREPADQWVPEPADARPALAHHVPRPEPGELLAVHAQVADQRGQPRVSGTLAAHQPEVGHVIECIRPPVLVQLAHVRVAEDELDHVGPFLGMVRGVKRQVSEEQGVPHRVPPKHVVAVANEDRGHVPDRGEHCQDAGPDALRPGPWPRRHPGGARQRVQVVGLVGVQPQRPGESVEYAVRGVAGQALLQPGVVGDAPPGELRQLLTAQAGHPPPLAVSPQADVLRRYPGATRPQETAKFVHTAIVPGAADRYLSLPVVPIAGNWVSRAPADIVAAVTTKQKLILTLLLGSQFMLSIDFSILNVALPALGRDLKLGAAELPWVATAFALPSAGLTLLFGRVGDLLGPRGLFLAGLVLLAAGSMAGGLAPSAGVLLAARFAQGLAAALAIPAALALLTTAFPEGPLRERALGLNGALLAGGFTVGALLGRVLTDFLSWRWAFLINVPIAVGIAIAAPAVIAESRHPQRPRLDAPGAVTVTTGLLALVYGV